MWQKPAALRDFNPADSLLGVKMVGNGAYVGMHAVTAVVLKRLSAEPSACAPKSLGT
jgi:hypothetical protein